MKFPKFSDDQSTEQVAYVAHLVDTGYHLAFALNMTRELRLPKEFFESTAVHTAYIRAIEGRIERLKSVLIEITDELEATLPPEIQEEVQSGFPDGGTGTKTNDSDG